MAPAISFLITHTHPSHSTPHPGLQHPVPLHTMPQHSTSATASCISHILQPLHPAPATASQPQHQYLMYSIQTGSWYLLLHSAGCMCVCLCKMCISFHVICRFFGAVSFMFYAIHMFASDFIFFYMFYLSNFTLFFPFPISYYFVCF